MGYNENIISILDDVLGKHRKHYSHKSQITYDCPVCSYEIKNLDEGDGKGNLEINYNLFVYNCWSCGYSHNTKGSLLKLIKKYGSEVQYKRLLLFTPEDVTKDIIKYEQIKLPSEYISFLNCSDGFKKTHFYKQAYNYLLKRNITDEIINNHGIGFCYEGKYSNRIIIPSFNSEGVLNYFVGRSYENKPTLKYLNPKQLKDEIIWNESNIDWNKTVYLVEGPFDSLFVNNSIALLGKKLSDKLFNLLYNKATEIVIILDGDAYCDSVKLFEKLNGGRLLNKVSLIVLPKDKDIADLKGEINNYEKIKLY